VKRNDAGRGGEAAFARPSSGPALGEAADAERPSGGTGRRVLSAAIGLAVLGGLYLTTFHSYLLFHVLAEGFSITVGAAIFMLAWNSRRFARNPYLLLLGVAYLCVSALDLVHTLAYKGMGVIPEAGGNFATQLWIGARYVEALSLLIAPLFIGRRLRGDVTFIAYVGVFALIVASVFLWGVFPVCLVEGAGLTPFKKISEYVISLVLLGSVGMLLRRRSSFDPAVLRLLVASILLTMAAEMAFTLYTDVYGLFNLIGHYLKILSFYFIYLGVLQIGLARPYSLLFRDLRQSEQALKAERDFVSAVLSTAGALVVVLDREGRIVRFNRACEDLTGYTFEEARGRAVWDFLLTDEESAPVQAVFRELQSGSFPNEYENYWVAKDGTRHRIAWSNTALLGPDSDVEYVIATGIDVTERRQAEADLRQALADKDVILAETHHRVRNNLQIIASLLELSRERADSAEAAAVLRDARDRIFAMGLIHTELYRADRFDLVDMELHVRNLAEHLAEVHAGRSTDVHLIIAASNVRLSLAQAVPCGLIVSELTSNAYRHAFEGRPGGTIEVTLAQLPDQMVSLRIRDDGVGIPEDIDMAEPKTLGLQLVRGLTDQLGGTIEIVHGDGTEVIVRFRLVPAATAMKTTE
jgi:PAS domain S-box-containing protein